MKWIFCLLVCYVLGSTPSGWLLGKKKGIDIREYGSGNIGATNVKRIFGIKYFLIVFFLDFCKGFIIYFLVPLFAGSHASNLIWLSAGLVTILGHIYPFWFYFKNSGKGIATATGVLLAILPMHLLIGFIIFLIIINLSHLVSLSSLSAAVAIFLYHLIFTDHPFSDNLLFTVFIFLTVSFVIFSHRKNIKRILKKQEPKTYFFKQSV